jgi:hypothetical protein
LGDNAGHLRGIWGVNCNGEKVFFGKYIGVNGEFLGLLSGQWTHDGDENRGNFQGQWLTSDRQAAGVLHGHFKAGRPGDGRGYLQGRWFEEI